MALSRTTNFLAAKIETLHDTPDKLVLRQRPGRLFRWGTWTWAVITVFSVVMVISELAGSTTTTRFTCSRASGHCERDGIRGTIPALADIERAELRRMWISKQGYGYAITLHARAGKTYDVDSYAALSEEAIASYRAAVDAINKFLADPTQPTLDTSFTYRPSLWEKIRGAVLTFFGLVLLAFALLLYRTTRVTVEPTKVTIVERGVFARSRTEVSADQIRAISADERLVSLELDDSRVVVLQATGRDPLADKLGALLAKPVR
jgi:hypothetical protein